MPALDLTSENEREFFNMIGGAKPTLVLFYADWCGHCQRFKPEWVKIDRELSQYKSLNIGQVNHDFFSLLPSHLQVHGFPTIQVIRKGIPVETYMGTRTRESIVQFALDFIGEKPKKKPVATLKKKVPIPVKKPVALAKRKALKDKKAK